jgi:hypothetical protein
VQSRPAAETELAPSWSRHNFGAPAILLTMPEATISRDAKILTIAVEGVTSRDDIIALIRENYPTLERRSTLWDFSRSDVTQLTAADFAAIAAVVGSVLPRDTPRKTAYLVADQKAYLIACKYMLQASSVRLPSEYAVFTTKARAQDWLLAP